MLTDRSLDRPDELYQFFKDLDPLEVGFNIEEIEGINTTSSLAGDGMRDKVTRFFARLLHLVRQDKAPLRIRELENGRSRLAGSLYGNACFASENNPLSILAVGADGRLATFSPELLQAPDDPSRDTFATVDDIDFTRLYDLPAFTRINDAVQAGVEACRRSCPYFSMCGGGAPANKLAEHGRFDATETMNCRLHIQALADVFDNDMAARIAVRQRHGQRQITGQNGGQNAGQNGGRPTPPAPVRLVPAGKPVIRSSAVFPTSGTVRVLCPPDRLEVSAGTADPASQGFDPARFKATALVARSPWRSVTAREYEVLNVRPMAGRRQFLALVHLPEDIRAEALQLGRMAAATIDSPGSRGADFASLEARVAAGLLGAFAGGPDAKPLGVLASHAGIPTLTSDNDDPLLWGLHVDSWVGLPVGARREAPNRMGVNIGSQPRRIQIVDIGLDRLAMMLPDVAGGAYELGNAFMRRYPDYPVLAMTLQPGEAYIAATENLIHDGSSVGMTQPDVLMTILGAYDLPDQDTVVT